MTIIELKALYRVADKHGLNCDNIVRDVTPVKQALAIIEYITIDIDDVKNKSYLMTSIRSHIKTVSAWKQYDTVVIDAALEIFFNVDGE